MKFKVNANTAVKVTLTESGLDILKSNHETVNKMLTDVGMETQPFSITIDEDGYFTTQLWLLMQTFGPHISMIKPSPFLIDIIFEEGELVEVIK